MFFRFDNVNSDSWGSLDDISPRNRCDDWWNLLNKKKKVAFRSGGIWYLGRKYECKKDIDTWIHKFISFLNTCKILVFEGSAVEWFEECIELILSHFCGVMVLQNVCLSNFDVKPLMKARAQLHLSNVVLTFDILQKLRKCFQVTIGDINKTLPQKMKLQLRRLAKHNFRQQHQRHLKTQQQIISCLPLPDCLITIVYQFMFYNYHSPHHSSHQPKKDNISEKLLLQK
jgi:hypothetical protein